MYHLIVSNTKEMSQLKITRSRLRHYRFILKPFKLQPEDSFMKIETCCCYVLLINYILCNKVVLD